MIVKKRKTCCPTWAPFSKMEWEGEVVIEQMCLDTVQIKEKMKDIVKKNIFEDELSKLLILFIESRKFFPFAESAFLHYCVFGGKEFEIAIELGAGIEIITLSSDILDDIQDNDNLTAPWMNIDQSVALSAVFSLYTVGLHSLNAVDPNSDIVNCIIKYCLDAMQGQHRDIINKPQTEEDCLEAMKLKCGSLFALANVSATMLATGTYNKVVESYSYSKGIFEQIYGDYTALFNPNRSDILKDKHTLVNLFLKRLFNKDSEELLTIFKNENLFYELLSKEEFMGKLKKAGVTQYVSVLHKIYKKKCETDIDKLNLDKHKIELVKKQLLN
ncbi:polyprenyl synthetase family protein [Bacillus atrophaeus]|uniref:polyprenyl synthetase family protein n=1 Tax=Bacillus atrophaeus TaxID=1452 RepID=UPI00280BB160|nr:polyprenyl synthetase family protein [Bacillus atrophaeus]